MCGTVKKSKYSVWNKKIKKLSQKKKRGIKKILATKQLHSAVIIIYFISNQEHWMLEIMMNSKPAVGSSEKNLKAQRKTLAPIIFIWKPGAPLAYFLFGALHCKTGTWTGVKPLFGHCVKFFTWIIFIPWSAFPLNRACVHFTLNLIWRHADQTFLQEYQRKLNT